MGRRSFARRHPGSFRKLNEASSQNENACHENPFESHNFESHNPERKAKSPA
jgi:hypothetical protein